MTCRLISVPGVCRVWHLYIIVKFRPALENTSRGNRTVLLLVEPASALGTPKCLSTEVTGTLKEGHLKRLCQELFHLCFFFIKLLLLVPKGTPRIEVKFFWIFVEISITSRLRWCQECYEPFIKLMVGCSLMIAANIVAICSDIYYRLVGINHMGKVCTFGINETKRVFFFFLVATGLWGMVSSTLVMHDSALWFSPVRLFQRCHWRWRSIKVSRLVFRD
jgi:hypothetical protein